LTYAGNLENLTEVESNPRYRFVHGDICDEQAVDSIVRDEQPDAIVFESAKCQLLQIPDNFFGNTSARAKPGWWRRRDA